MKLYVFTSERYAWYILPLYLRVSWASMLSLRLEKIEGHFVARQNFWTCGIALAKNGRR